LALAATLALGQDCVWDKDTQYPLDPPLVIDLNTWRTVHPKMEGAIRTVRVAAGTTLVLACPENSIFVLQLEVAEATCLGGETLSIGGVDYTMSQLTCTSSPKEAIQQGMGPCGANGELSNIGFDVVGYQWYPLIDVCFEPVFQTTLYETHIIRGESILAKDVDSSRPSFKSDTGFFTVDANNCYLQASQITLMEDILGDSSVIDTSTELYFSRGHLAPDADFVTEQEQDATYYYINAVPQWQAFNNGNWKYTEYGARDVASGRATDIQIWSGGWRVLQLDDVNNNPVDIFLGLTEAQEVIPAPELTWKVIYDPAANEGAAVVGFNNPYLTASPSPICGSESFCSNFPWLAINPVDYGNGASYCCSVQDLKAAVPNAPDLGDAGLLTSI